MKRLSSISSLSSLSLVLLVACGGAGGKGAGSASRAPRGPVVVLSPVGDHAMAPLGCYDGTTTQADCLALALRLGQPGVALVDGGGGAHDVTGKVSDDCGASGPTDVVGVSRSDQPDTDGNWQPLPEGLAVLPRGAAIDYQPLPQAATTDDGAVTPLAATALPAGAADALAKLINGSKVLRENLADGETPEPVLANQIQVTQYVHADLDGDGTADALFVAHVDGPEQPGYRWSGMAFASGGALDKLVEQWGDSLSHVTLNGTLDLDGDGHREVYLHSEYYEGGSMSVVRFEADGSIVSLGSWECGA